MLLALWLVALFTYEDSIMNSYVVIMVRDLPNYHQDVIKVRLFASSASQALIEARELHPGYSTFSIREQQ